MRILFIAILILSMPGGHRLYGQGFEENDFKLYTTRHGLSHNRVNDLAIDKHGFLWLGTESGLNRFDGHTFRQFFADTGLGSLPGDVVKNLQWFDREYLGVTTAGGQFVMNTSRLSGIQVRVQPLNQVYEFGYNNAWDAVQDKTGDEYLLTSAGFYHYDANRRLLFRYDHRVSKDGVLQEVPFGRPRGIVMAGEDLILLSTTDGLYSYIASKKKIQKGITQTADLDTSIAPPGTTFHFMHRDSRGFSTLREGGTALAMHDLPSGVKHTIEAPFSTTDKFDWRSRIFRINDTTLVITARTGGFYLIAHDAKNGRYVIQPRLYLEKYPCSSVALDEQYRLWIGTSKGLLHQKKAGIRIDRFEIPSTMNPKAKNLSIRMIAKAKDRLFVATSSEGILVLNRLDFKPVHQIDFSAYTDQANAVFSVLPLNEDTILAGSYGPLVWVDTRRFRHAALPLQDWVNGRHWVGAQFKDSRNNLYLCRNETGEYYFRKSGTEAYERMQFPDNPLFSIRSPRNISEDKQGNIWFSGHGISRFNMRTKQFDLKLDSFPRIGSARREATNIEFDRSGRMYFGLPNTGLIIYDPARNMYKQITRANGLPGNTILAVFLREPILWIGTESGLASYDIETGHLSAFGLADDFPESGFTAYAFYFDTEHHHLYAAFNNTIVRFNPDSLRKNNIPPRLLAEHVRVGDQETIFYPADTLFLNHRQNYLTIKLLAINFDDAHQQRYAYRFMGVEDTVWRQLEGQQQIVLGNLTPGAHHLQYKVFNKTMVWPEQVRDMLIMIQPPFWQTNWFRLLFTMLVFGTVYGAVRFRIRSERKKTEMVRKLAEIEIKGLHAQMNPHFIFNALNSIKEMILDDNKKDASRYLSKFAQLIRTSLEHSTQAFVSVEQCVDHLRQYLEMEKIRFDQFEYRISVSPEIPAEEVRLAPMLVQPLVENAIWHGLRGKLGEKLLEIRFTGVGSQLQCVIDDNGIGINQSRAAKSDFQVKHRSLGIENVRERIKILNEKYQMNCSLHIDDKSDLPNVNGTGTIAVLKLTI